MTPCPDIIHKSLHAMQRSLHFLFPVLYDICILTAGILICVIVLRDGSKNLHHKGLKILFKKKKDWKLGWKCVDPTREELVRLKIRLFLFNLNSTWFKLADNFIQFDNYNKMNQMKKKKSTLNEHKKSSQAIRPPSWFKNHING